MKDLEGRQMRLLDPDRDELANGWTRLAVEDSLKKGSSVFVDVDGNIWSERDRSVIGKVAR